MTNRIYCILSVALTIGLSIPAGAQQLIKVIGQDGVSPATSSNPVPTSSGSSTGNVQVETGSGPAVVSSTNPLYVGQGVVTQANQQSTRSTLTGSSQALSFSPAVSTIDLVTDPGSAITYISPTNATATSSMAAIQPGQPVELHFAPSITSLQVLGASGTINALAR